MSSCRWVITVIPCSCSHTAELCSWPLVAVIPHAAERDPGTESPAMGTCVHSSHYPPYAIYLGHMLHAGIIHRDCMPHIRPHVEVTPRTKGSRVWGLMQGSHATCKPHVGVTHSGCMPHKFTCRGHTQRSHAGSHTGVACRVTCRGRMQSHVQGSHAGSHAGVACRVTCSGDV